MRVGEALQAVVAMDGDLKKDLKKVKEEIKKGIKDVIEDLNVLSLDTKVKEDLQALRGKILGLSSNVGDRSDDDSNIVGDQLKDLKNAKMQLDVLTDKDTGTIQMETKNLETNFKEKIQGPLNTKVQEVGTAIGELGGKFDSKVTSIDGILGKIKGEVGKIQGKPGRDSGLEGIVKKVKELTNAFVKGRGNNSGFNGRVGGWLEGVIGNGKGRPGTRDHKPGLQAVTSWLQQSKDAVTKHKYKESDFTDQVKNKIMQQTEISHAIAAAQGKIKQVVDGKVVDNLSAIVSACEEFVKELDKKITKTEIERFAPAIAKEIQRWMDGQGLQNFTQEADLTTAVKYILVALCASVRQVGNEINSLGTDKFGQILDQIKPIVDELNEQLEAATSKPTGQNESPAKAVDMRLGEVKNEVNNNIVTKFRENVIKELKEAVRGLPGAVQEFDRQAQTQIKAAAETAITKAAEEIKTQSGNELDVKATVETFHKAHDDIKKTLQGKLNEEVETHIGEDDPPAPAGDPKFKLAEEHFKTYNSHVDQNSVKAFDTNNPDDLKGQLPEKIQSISKEGLRSLTDVIDASGGADKQITQQTFTGPFVEITKQLEEVRKWVDERNGTGFTGETIPGKGVKNYLEHLKNGLNNGPFADGYSGLENIKTTIQNLHNNQFTTQPAAIGTAVQEIKTELKKLREKLKGKYGSKQDVITALTIIKRDGLSNGDWHNGNNFWTPNGEPLSGLGRIENELKEQNDELDEQNKQIGDAMKIVIQEIKAVLRNVGMKLKHDYITDDVVDHLQWLKHRIGQGTPYNGNLQKIYNAIRHLHDKPFNTHPDDIHKANSTIKLELTALQNVLLGSQGKEDVINTLDDLQNVGLSGDMWDKNTQGKGKSLKNIQDYLNTQQTTLSSQPTAIRGGVDQITGELTKLQKQLSDDVTKKLDDLKNHGLGSKQNWDIDEHSAKGLTTITADIEAIKSKDVDSVKHYLIALCSAIKHNARDLRDILKEVKEILLDKQLRKFYSDLYDLYFGPLNDVIQSLKAFDKYVLAASLI
ncbi:Extracellular matrix-binding ebh, putative [Babesia ovata]|uniref:Extracellular matrix-binding ebh, putative n=1 Tax=Babesia ovata TaxID=189622 RepID=A0A2H6KHM7_9APIC|nr:Extracellular matrix-binding ebh, putative [Babesia ovata]GBE62494.1 Extracellular matrix-binding ebh, putative [Babesia ovata]